MDAMSESGALVIDDVVAGYGAAAVLRGVSVTAAPGTITAILGANGAGKTTLLRTVDGSIRPTSGRIMMDGTDLAGRRPEDVARSAEVDAVRPVLQHRHARGHHVLQQARKQAVELHCPAGHQQV